MALPASASALCAPPPAGTDAFTEVRGATVAFLGTANPGAVNAQGELRSPAAFTVNAGFLGTHAGATEPVEVGVSVDDAGVPLVSTPPVVHPGEQWLVDGERGQGGAIAVSSCTIFMRKVDPTKAPKVRVGSKVITAAFSTLKGKAALGTPIPDLPSGTRSLKIEGAEAVVLRHRGKLVRPRRVGSHRWSLKAGGAGDRLIWIDANGLWAVGLVRPHSHSA